MIEDRNVDMDRDEFMDLKIRVPLKYDSDNSGDGLCAEFDFTDNDLVVINLYSRAMMAVIQRTDFENLLKIKW